jgi:hypothetical protein
MEEEITMSMDQMMGEPSEEPMMSDPIVQVLILMNQLNLITEIQEVLVDFGEPNCKLTKPYLISDDGTLSPWLKGITNDEEIMMSSDKILTLVEPTEKLLDEYTELTK